MRATKECRMKRKQACVSLIPTRFQISEYLPRQRIASFSTVMIPLLTVTVPFTVVRPLFSL